MTEIAVLLASTVALSAPLILAAMGGWFSERSGVINIGLEGKMLVATILVFLVGLTTGSAAFGVAAGIAGSVALALVHWLMTQSYRVDPIVSGMAINALALGLANFLHQKFGRQLVGPPPLVPLQVFTVLAFALPFVLAVVALRTRLGVRLRAAGSDPEKARQVGLHPIKIRMWALVGTGVCCGLSGVWILTNARFYTDNMTAGRGFIALAALILGGWRPIPAMIACVGFALFQALQVQLQGSRVMGVRIPPEFWFSLPYLITVIALAGFLGRSRAPRGLGKV